MARPPPPNKRRKYRGAQKPRPTSSVSHLKKKVRDLERLLSRPNSNLPADVQVESERALAAFQRELKIAEAAKREQKITKKYHMVRFFERQKATRRLNKVKRQLAATKEPAEELLEQLREAEVELNYALYYPRGEKYIALFKDPGENLKVREKREAIKREIEKRMETGALGDRTTEDGGENEGGDEETYQKQMKTEQKLKSKKGKAKIKVNEEDADIRNDDFFEF